MMAFLLTLALGQDLTCPAEAVAHARAAAARADALDLAGAADAYLTAAGLGCASADIAARYLRALIAAREAYREGGSTESLAPVREAVELLDARGAQLPGPTQIVRAVLLAAAAAAQSEREEMALFIEHAISLEALQLAAGQPGAPGVTAHEIAGDLWLQVHRYDDARRAYTRAAERLGTRPRMTLGLARVAVRLKDTDAACAEYRMLAAWWGSRTGDTPEILETRTYLAQPECAR